MQLIQFLFRGPFWVQLLLAAVLAWAGHSYSESQIARQATLRALAGSAQPEATVLEDWAGAGGARVAEVNLDVRLLLDHNIHLVKKTNFITTSEAYLYSFGTVAEDGSTLVRGGIVLSEAERDRFAEWAVARSVGLEGADLVIRLEGLTDSPSEASHAKSALREEGLVLAPDFFFVAPFLDGRDAGMAAAVTGAGQSGPNTVYGVAAFFALLGLRRFGRRKPAVEVAPVPVAAAPQVLRNDDGSPVLRFAPSPTASVPRAIPDAAQRAATQAAAQQAVADAASAGTASAAVRQAGRRKPASLVFWIGAALLAFAIVYALNPSYAPLVVLAAGWLAFIKLISVVVKLFGSALSSVFGRRRPAV